MIVPEVCSLREVKRKVGTFQTPFRKYITFHGLRTLREDPETPTE